MEMHCELANEKSRAIFPSVDTLRRRPPVRNGRIGSGWRICKRNTPRAPQMSRACSSLQAFTVHWLKHDHSVSVRVQRSPSTMQHILPRTVQFSICDNSKPITSAPTSCSPTAHSAATQEPIGNIADLQLCAGYEPNVQLIDPFASVHSGMERSSTATLSVLICFESECKYYYLHMASGHVNCQCGRIITSKLRPRHRESYTSLRRAVLLTTSESVLIKGRGPGQKKWKLARGNSTSESAKDFEGDLKMSVPD